MPAGHQRLFIASALKIRYFNYNRILNKSQERLKLNKLLTRYTSSQRHSWIKERPYNFILSYFSKTLIFLTCFFIHLSIFNFYTILNEITLIVFNNILTLPLPICLPYYVHIYTTKHTHQTHTQLHHTQYRCRPPKSKKQKMEYFY